MKTIDKRKYLDPLIVAKLDNMALRARLVVEGYLIGQHKSPYHGFSVEFAEHRAYGSGDEIRHIDWKLYGKTDRYYVKRYEEETNLRSYILLDTSQSMTYGSGAITKLEYGSYLSAALTYLMLNQKDAMGLVLFDEKIRKFIPPRAAPSHANIIMGALDKIQSANDTQIRPTLDYMAERIKKRGLVILISDLLDDPDQVLMGLNHFRYNKQEMIVFHLLDRQELEFQFGDRTKFRDLETDETITTEPWHIRSAYQELIEMHQRKYRLGCRNQRIDYVPLFTDQPLDL
ncbi:MAG TPA: DUF58 domain-containing protein, partial [Candidatus Marinimicrobia bacterium]|nr:DUF58 domain-containing protein [Candidatus Neomarinimicrobiota bacterium]